jgi:helicase MOV-10
MVTEDPIWALTIPGLREDSPFLEMGDMLQLRQLWIGNDGNITDVPMLVDGSERLFGQATFLKGWTGVQYDACVYGVNRAKEVVYLKANDLGFLHNYRPVPMGVNVVFPLKQTKIDTQQRTLRFIASQLDMVDRSPMHTQQYVTDGGFDDFNDMASLSNESSKAPGQGKETAQNPWIQRMLFPTEAHGEMQTELRRIPHRALFDHAINYEQAHAVNSICTRDYGTLPYLISGPPGTGKTKTLVETAMQLFNTSESTHTLICAPSEAAADTLALRLKKYLSNEQLFRLIRPGRNDTEVPGELTPYCYMTNDMFSLPSIKAMMAYNIVVTSCQDAGILFDARLTNDDLWHIERNMLATFHPEDQVATPRLHWGALLIDEAAQATEIDLLAAISVACPPSSYPTDLPQPLFIMAGDENQLGPKTASRDPHFSESLFARLAQRPLYKTHPLSRSSVKPSAAPPVLKKTMLPIVYPPFTNLIRNYRSHPAILSVPSSLFYNDTLIPESPTPNTPLQTSPLWLGRKWPVLFVPNTAPDEIERDGGGWYNIAEAHIACSIAQQLIRDSGVAQKDICIMSPFAAQVKLLRSRIRSQQYGLWDVNIGPLEAFQGLEKRVVIVCTTRTRARFLVEDERRGLGIVQQKRKMNVALTRAKEALFVVGNPEILVRDECWKMWLAFCWRNGLVDDRGEGWDGGAEGFGEGNVGVLERALVAKEDSVGETGKVLGRGAQGLDMSRDYEVWMDSLREALDEESEDIDEEEEEMEDEDGEE